MDKRIKPSSHPDDKSHNAGFAAAKAAYENSQGSMRSEQCEEPALQTAEGGAQSAPSKAFSRNGENKIFAESQHQYKLFIR